MPENPEIPPGFKEKIVFTIQIREKLGAILVPCLVHMNDTDELGYFYQRLYLHTIPKHLHALSEEEMQVFHLLEECSDTHLCRKFSNQTRNHADFFADIDEVRLKSLVIPYVQSRIHKSLEILGKAKIPLYYKGGKTSDIRSEPVAIMQNHAKVLFLFEKDDHGSRYRMRIRYVAEADATQWEEISLKRSPALVLVNKPGWVLAGNRVYRLEDGVDGVKARPFFKKDFISIPATSEEYYFRSFIAKAIKNHEVRLNGIGITEHKPGCLPVLKLENDWTGKPALLLEFHYDNKQCTQPDKGSCWVDVEAHANSYSFTKTCRDKTAEIAFVDLLLSWGLKSRDNIVFKPNSSFQKSRGSEALNQPKVLDASDETGATGKDAVPTPTDETGDNPLLFSTIEWLAAYDKQLSDKGFCVQQNIHKQRYFIGSPDLEMTFSSKTDWFDVFAYAVFGKHRIPFYKLRNHLLNGEKQFVLPDGEIAILPEEWFAKYHSLLVFGKAGKEHIRLRKHHFTIVNELIHKDDTENAASFQTTDNDNIKHRAEKLERLLEKDSIPFPDIPAALKNVLRTYQAAGFAWMHLLGQQGLGGCLSDDMGLGKTLQCLSLLWKHKLDHAPEPAAEEPAGKESIQLDLFSDVAGAIKQTGRTSLIVMPLSLIHNWENEIRRFTPELTHTRYYGKNRETRPEVLMKYDIVLTTYGMVRNDLDFFCRFRFFYLILDESQIIKNPDAKVSRAVQRLQADNRLVLTGTPIENSLTDLWSQFNFLNPGLLGSRKFFQKSFASPIEKTGNEQKQEELKRLIEPYILRRTKSLVEKDLPELTEQLHFCEMHDAQKKRYESKKSEIRNRIFAKAGDEDKSGLRFDILRGLMQLRLIANHPDLTGKSENALPRQLTDNDDDLQPGDNGYAISGKFDEVIRIIQNLRAEGHKLLIFSQFVKHLKLFSRYFEAHHWKYAFLTGAQSTSERQQLIEDFRRDPDKLLFLISLKAGGVGLNLTEAGYVLLLDPWWNPAVEQQAISRAHRIGQKKPVIAYKFITSGTVEEKIHKLQQKKSQLAGDLISTNNPLSVFSEEEMLQVLE